MSWCDKVVKWLQTTTLRHLQLHICVSENKIIQTIVKWSQLQLYKIGCSLSWYTSAVKWYYMQFNKFSKRFFFFFSCLSLHWFKTNFVKKWSCRPGLLAKSKKIIVLVSEARSEVCRGKLCPTEVETFRVLYNVHGVQKKSLYRLWMGHKNTETLIMKPLWIFSRLILRLHHLCKSPTLKTNDYTRGTNLFWTKY